MKKILLASITLLLFTTIAYALKRDEINFTRYFTLNKVDIDIISDGDLNNVLPQSDYNYEVKIVNHGEDCYVRIPDDMPSVEMDTTWVRVGNYYYYPEVLKSNSEILFANHIHLLDFNQEDDDIEWTIKAEAIQANHFELNLEKEDPFDGIEILSFEDIGGDRS